LAGRAQDEEPALIAVTDMDNSNKQIALISVVNADMAAKLSVPVGLIYVGSALEEYGYNVQVFQPIDGTDQIEQVEEEVCQIKPLFVGFSVFMGPGSITSLEMSERLKQRLGVNIVWGGKYPSSIPVDVLKERAIDAVCIGEGEETVVELARCWETNGELSSVKGTAFRDGDEVKLTQPRPLIEDLDKLEYNLHLIRDWPRYLTHLNGRPALIDVFESQRGCLYRCRFCYQSKILFSDRGKKIVRAHSVEWVLDKARRLKEMTGVEYISFCDDEFWIKRNRAFAIMDGLARMGIRQYKVRMRITSLKDKEMVQRLLDYGVSDLGFGLESGVDRVLKLMNKGQTTKQIESKIRLLASFPEIRPGGLVILGSPTETKDEVRRTLRFYTGLQKINPSFVFGMNIYMPLPNTEFFDLAVQEGFKPPRSLREWAETERHQVHRIAGQWLPWFNARAERDVGRLEEYLNIIAFHRRPDLSRPRGKAFKAATGLLERLARARVGHWFFYMPAELYLQMLYRRLKRRRLGRRGNGV
jgi:anaerobic magnesium-protoporphyrin IX monomethyl ester cyclase